MSLDNEQKELIDEAVKNAMASYFTGKKLKDIEKKVHKALDDELDYLLGDGFTESSEGMYEDLWNDLTKSLIKTVKNSI